MKPPANELNIALQEAMKRDLGRLFDMYFQSTKPDALPDLMSRIERCGAMYTAAQEELDK